ncbi:hypothetical protein LEN26_013237 [Aphanomyces euteiches]|nr:hypothetical protein AeMF1_015465 [Aphanomyces euteiches]KAH9112696.1 hypothetical protein LEN26_013237 [Aphanomyces euteiches]KAH9114012.1 hypothetical protein AeMF1_011877 [Aphanomyces euteiches]KAH9125203.1 hypothetical protein AeMF1_004164 [Aphanomyces euteiches]KAH9126546.1 hypothetical protein AeMF1_003032 [Aphanomyces euteiches]
MEVLHGNIARIDDAVAKVNRIRESAEKALSDMCSTTNTLLAEVATSIKQVDSNMKQSRENINAEMKADIMNEFVQFLSENVEVRNTKGLAFLAQAFVWQDTTMIQEFVEESINVVIFSKRPNTTSRPFETPEKSTVPADASSAKRTHLDADAGDVEQKRRRLSAESNVGTPITSELELPTKATVPATPEIDPVKEEPQDVAAPPVVDVDAFTPIVEKKLGKAFANKWLRIVMRAPWTQWAASFISFLPGRTPGQVDFNRQLQQFFVNHGRALWERYFFLGSTIHSSNTEPSKRFRRLRAAMGNLIYDLYKLEGADVFLFLESHPHPFWPTIFNNPVPLDTAFPNHSRELLAYFQDQYMKRWPTYHGYWTPPVGVDVGYETFRPNAFLEWAASRTADSCLADKWTFIDHEPKFFVSLLASMEEKREGFDLPNCPYVSVVLPKSLPKQWKFPRGAQSKYKWDEKTGHVVENRDPVVKTTPSRRTSKGLRKST